MKAHADFMRHLVEAATDWPLATPFKRTVSRRVSVAGLAEAAPGTGRVRSARLRAQLSFRNTVTWKESQRSPAIR